MKKLMILFLLLLTPVMAEAASSNARGLLWMDTTESVYINPEITGKSTKIGTSESINILRLITSGDAGIKKAMENGDIKKVHYVDQEIKKFLVLFEKRTTKVYGE